MLLKIILIILELQCIWRVYGEHTPCLSCDSISGDALCPEIGVNWAAVERPCPDMDVCCVSEWFQRRVKCINSPVRSEASSISLNPLVLYLTNFNTTAVQKTAISLGHAEIVEFYINKETDFIVLSVKFDDVISKANSTILYNQIGKEALELQSEFHNTFEALETTTIFRGIHNPQLERSVTTAYAFQDTLVDFGKCFREVKDPKLTKLYKEMDKKKSTVLRESFLTIGPVIASNFIQAHLCNYGLEYIQPLYDPVVLL